MRKAKVERLIRKDVEMNKRKYTLNEQVFDCINHESAYWIGYLYGEGNCTTENKIRICCAENDINSLTNFRNFIGSDKPIKRFLAKNKYPSCGFEIRSWKLHKALKRYELTKLKKDRGDIHIDLLQDEISKDFIRGLFDADGSFYYDGLHNNHLFAEIIGYMPVLKNVKSILVRHKVINETKKIVTNGKLFRLRFNQSECLKLINFMYDGKPRYLLQRNYGIARSYLDRLNETTDKSEVIVD